MTPMEISAQAHAAGVTAYNALAESDGDCQCEDCFVRDILEAAWPHLQTLVRALDSERPVADRLAVAVDKVDPMWLPHFGSLG